MKPFETLFFEVGAEILKNISGYIAASPQKAVQKIRKGVISAIKAVRSGGDVKKNQHLSFNSHILMDSAKSTNSYLGYV